MKKVFREIGGSGMIYQVGMIKDGIIIITSTILVFSLLELRKLKRIISQQVHERLLPQLSIDLVCNPSLPEEMGLYLKNESSFLAKDILIEDLNLTLDDSGYRIGHLFKFELIDFLKPQEIVKLKFKVFDEKNQFLPEVTERIFPHLLSPVFRIKISCSNIENVKFCVLLSKKREKFFIERIYSV